MPKRKLKQRGGNPDDITSGENVLKKRKSMISRILSIFVGHGKLKIITALMVVTTIWHLFISKFWKTGINTFITLGLLMFTAFVGGSFFTKWAFPLSSILILLQLGGLFYVNFEHMDFIKKGKNIPREYNIFMTTSLSVIVIQLIIMILSIAQSLSKNLFSLNNWFLVSLFLLSTIICGISIGQVWVILEKLKCDC